jgi:3-(3-hydroxy-phenyl)propionate hydroxylase
MTDLDVVVVGFGPVGATVAGLAAQQGLRVLAVDRDTEIYPLPRAVQCDHEILRILQGLGVADEVLGGSVLNEGMDFLTAERVPVLSFTVPAMAPTGWPTSIFFHQPTYEATLRRRVIELGAQVRLGVEVCDVTADAERRGATVTLADGSHVHARFVVACDGARSTVRKALGITMRDSDFEEPWLVVDLRLDESAPTLATRCLQVCDPARPHTLVPMPGNRFRFEFMLLPGEKADDINQPAVIHELLASWLDPALATIERTAVYTFHGLVASEWRRGPIFLAGDAAHQTPPFLGQGMCAGMRDAANLVWKLAAVAGEGAPDRLLDTYQDEREPHAQQIIDTAVEFGRMICLLDPEAAAERDGALQASQPEPDQVPDLLPPLRRGSLVGPDAGDLTGQPWIGGRRLDDVVGPRWLLVVDRLPEHLGADGAANDVGGAPGRPGCRDGDADRLAWWRERGEVLEAAAHPELGDLLDGHRAVAVRPDRYTAARGSLDEVTKRVAAALIR